MRQDIVNNFIRLFIEEHIQMLFSVNSGVNAGRRLCRTACLSCPLYTLADNSFRLIDLFSRSHIQPVSAQEIKVDHFHKTLIVDSFSRRLFFNRKGIFRVCVIR